ncbi:RNA polymerase sigma factor [Amycolatopsis dendrobii]|uniref:Sigma-70 family RNA polymerase sigma factor n=1 Tax=Amycolatopsis dendrobii TaxID=2760662 RepID=A0A7W3VW63_9PSEU|nr:sigma-70 family RNA polymerase sigma factor [Amycolatopsis dendrobii]MBB1154358.1 sigma-70 family RNA polymerase sigma factor [Amycolatopsis dendrobii]
MPERNRARSSAAPTSDTSSDYSRNDEFSQFYYSTVRDLTGFLIMQGARLADAADIAQDTLCSAYRLWSAINNPRAWSYRTASRALLRRLVSGREDLVGELPEPSPLLRATAIDGWEQQQDIVVLLDRLPPRQRQVMAWTLYGYTPKEIADELGIRPEAVRANLMKARRALAQHLPREEGSR